MLRDDVNPLPPIDPSRRKRAKPTLIPVGVRKGGRGAINRFLALNPRISTLGNEAEGEQWYLKRLPEMANREVLFEKTPDYFNFDFVPGRIKKFHPEQKMLVMLRDR
ncbi:hypothetical protein CAPTEDRAFT_186899 [Capitella teleta]|uniref:Sulfotransferase domain-containing protein n=1 Tax=Capitella teleta TaxID=283909 RepID=R7TGB7_CAPTE|nr:hypothetical protein CAPTEDRAFT_186899 [Capitella teleta]|eukprot:ELT92537.1 hypothetical protein CAPTEDRAFT_186899 [Capitella teleta]